MEIYGFSCGMTLNGVFQSELLIFPDDRVLIVVDAFSALYFLYPLSLYVDIFIER